MVAGAFASGILFAPLSFDSRAPYLAASYIVTGAILALAVYGFHTALAGRPLFGDGFLKDEGR